MAFTPSNDIIDVLKNKLGLTEKTLTILKIWEKELGALSKDVYIKGIYRGNLIVEVSSSSHFQEMNLRRKSLINKINQYFGKEKVVKGIKFKLKDN